MEWKALPPSCPSSSRRKSRTAEGCALRLPRREPLELEGDDFEIPILFDVYPLLWCENKLLPPTWLKTLRNRPSPSVFQDPGRHSSRPRTQPQHSINHPPLQNAKKSSFLTSPDFNPPQGPQACRQRPSVISQVAGFPSKPPERRPAARRSLT